MNTQKKIFICLIISLIGTIPLLKAEKQPLLLWYNQPASEWMKSLYSVKNANNQDIQFVLNMPEIDDNYLTLFEIRFIEGRNFSKNISSDLNDAAIINQTAAKTFVAGMPHTIGIVLQPYSLSPS